MDFIRYWSLKTGLVLAFFFRRLDIAKSKFYDWTKRYGKANEHNALVPRDWWLQPWEKLAVIHFAKEHRGEGYRRLTFMMLDKGIVAVSPKTTYNVLRHAGLMRPWNGKKSLKGTGFVQPTKAHQEWHIDVSHINIKGTFYYLCSLIDGYSRYIVHWEIREAMREADIEIIVLRALEKFPNANPRMISDNGPQFVSRDFKEFIRLCSLTHTRTSPYYPQSNGKQERWHKSLKSECVRPKTPLSLDDARRVVGEYVEKYNNERLHSAIGYIAPKDKLDGREKQIWAERDRKLEAARAARKAARQAERLSKSQPGEKSPELDKSAAETTIPNAG